MKKITIAMFCLAFFVNNVNAQAGEDEETKHGFKKENLFTGGSLSANFGQGRFSVGLVPCFGYSFNKFIDIATTLNYNYISVRSQFSTAKARQSIIGPGGFLRVYPVKFLFAQAQYEYNFIKETQIPGSGFNNYIDNYKVQSFLVGAGYASGREGTGESFYYFTILVDVADNNRSPYKDEFNRQDLIFRTGVHIPLFQGNKSGGGYKKSRDDY
jgi:hypothetical protein